MYRLKSIEICPRNGIFLNVPILFLDDLAWLYSPTLIAYNQNDADSCSLRLHYHMWGENIRRLSVHSRTQDGGPLNERIWTKSGQQGSFWERVDIPLKATPNVPFQVYLSTIGFITFLFTLELHLNCTKIQLFFQKKHFFILC